MTTTEYKAEAWDIVSKRAKDAHKYCQDYLMPDAWGRNIWHAVLDDAIRMRKEKEKENANQCDDHSENGA